MITSPIFWLPILALGVSCGSETPKNNDASAMPTPLDDDVMNAISAVRMKELVDYLADDDKGGRVTGTFGHLAAMNRIIDEMEEIGLEPIGIEGDYLYPFPATPNENFYAIDEDGGISVANAEIAYDLVGRIPGSNPDLAHEHILVMAHYDHLGVDASGTPFNGAFDNAAGVAVAAVHRCARR